MVSSGKRKRIEVLKENLDKYYTLLNKYEKELLLAPTPKDEMRCELEIKKLKQKITQFEQELIEINDKQSERLIPSPANGKYTKNILTGVLVLALILAVLYSINNSKNSNFAEKNEHDSVLTKNDSITKLNVNKDLNKPNEINADKHINRSFKFELKTSTDPCGSNDFKKFPTGKVHLNIWVNKPSENKLRITWGDGSEDILSSSSLSCYSISHSYTTIGEKEIRIIFTDKNDNVIKIANKKITINSI